MLSKKFLFFYKWYFDLCVCFCFFLFFLLLDRYFVFLTKNDLLYCVFLLTYWYVLLFYCFLVYSADGVLVFGVKL